MGQPQTAVGVALRVALAHHPLCSVFAYDVYMLGPLRVCRGCAVAVPMFILGAVAALVLLQARLEALVLAAGSLALGVPQAVTYVWRGGPGWRFFVKAVGGAGLGGLVVAVFAWQAAFSVRLAVLIGLGLVSVALQGVRVAQMMRTCRRCPWQMDWERCPGFAGN